MRTECFCTYCPKHPKHGQKFESPAPTGYDPSHLIGPVMCDEHSANVECLKPVSDAFYEFDIDVDREEFPVTAYGDGCAITGFSRDGIVLYARCGNETRVEVD